MLQKFKTERTLAEGSNGLDPAALLVEIEARENFPERQFRKLVHHHLLASIPDFNRLEPILAATVAPILRSV
jgi:hypothetical protein